MKKVDDGGPAFPVRGFEGEDRNGDTMLYGQLKHGMSLRDYFAGQVVGPMATAYASVAGNDSELGKLASACYRFADAMVAEKQRTEGGGDGE